MSKYENKISADKLVSIEQSVKPVQDDPFPFGPVEVGGHSPRTGSSRLSDAQRCGRALRP